MDGNINAVVVRGFTFNANLVATRGYGFAAAAAKAVLAPTVGGGRKRRKKVPKKAFEQHWPGLIWPEPPIPSLPIHHVIEPIAEASVIPAEHYRLPRVSPELVRALRGYTAPDINLEAAGEYQRIHEHKRLAALKRQLEEWEDEEALFGMGVFD